MATAKKKGGGPAGFEFDCDSEPIPPGTKAGRRWAIEDQTRPIPAWYWLITVTAVAASLIVGVLIGRAV